MLNLPNINLDAIRPMALDLPPGRYLPKPAKVKEHTLLIPKKIR